jgi:hypothetical protein
MHFTIGNEDALQLFRHDVIPILSMLALPCYSPQCRPGNMLRQRTMRAARQRQSEKRRGKGRPRRGCPGPTPSILNSHLEATFFRAVERFASTMFAGLKRRMTNRISLYALICLKTTKLRRSRP